MLHKRWVWVPSLVALLLFANCIRVEIVGEGKSEAHLVITTTLHFHFKPTKDITFPENFFIPQLAGLSLGAGSEIDIDIEPGEITFEDSIVFGGDSSGSTANPDGQGTGELTAVRVGPGLRGGNLVAVPAPTDRVTLTGTVNPGSTYTWVLPDLFGEENPAVVPVTGTISAVANSNALIQDADTGEWSLRPGGLVSFSYRVTGPAAVWHLPMQTPFGEFPGEGTIETDPMVFESSGTPGGTGVEGYTDPNGNTWEYGYVGSFPVQLTVGGEVAIGATTVDGGFDLF
jgi:hypothetical protein